MLSSASMGTEHALMCTPTPHTCSPQSYNPYSWQTHPFRCEPQPLMDEPSIEPEGHSFNFAGVDLS